MTPLDRDYHQNWLDSADQKQAREDRWTKVAVKGLAWAYLVTVVFVSVAGFMGVEW